MSTPKVEAEPATALNAGRLYVALGRITRAVRRDASASVVGHGSLSALATLDRDGPQRLGALAAAEGVSPPSMTRIVTALEAGAHLRRLTDPEDGRAHIVEITDAGRELVAGRTSEKLAVLAARLRRLDPVARAALEAALPALEQLAHD